jgi:hypothetical protein
MNKYGLKSLLVIAVSFSLMNIASAQDFMVLSSQGTSTVDGVGVKIGSVISGAKVIKVTNGASLGLAHSSGKTVQINSSGDFKTSDIETKVNATKDGVVQSYAGFVVNELTSGGNIASTKSKMGNTGSVSRAMSFTDEIQIMLPENSNIIPDSKIKIKWFVKDGVEKVENAVYIFEVKDLHGKVIISEEVHENEISIDPLKLGQAHKNGCVFSVSPKNSTTVSKMEYRVKYLKGRSILDKAIMGQYRKVSEQYSSETVADYMAIATFFAENDMHANAIYAYETALEKEPNNVFVKMVYESYLKRNNLSKEARSSAASSLKK